MNAALNDKLIEAIGSENVSSGQYDLNQASSDESDLPAALPDVVTWAQTTAQVQAIVNICREDSVPLTVRGAGSSLEGNPIPVNGGVVLDITRMNRIVAVEPDNLLARVEPGVIYNDLNDKLRSCGLFFPTSPGGSADVATIGGMVANNASGIFALKYGATADHVLALTAVTGAGEIIETGHQCPKSSSGYDLSSLLCGSEGTLAIITEITLKLCGRPAIARSGAVTFTNEVNCAQTIATLVAGGVDLAACEYLDQRCIRALNEFKDYQLSESPMLLFEVHGLSDAAVAETLDVVHQVCADFGGSSLQLAHDPWKIRHWATRAVRAQHPDSTTLRCDVAFPIAGMPTVVQFAHQVAEEHGLNLYAFGHAGLGIIHILMQVPNGDSAHSTLAKRIKDDIVAQVIDLGGTCSGEHGIGLGNRRYMESEHGIAIAVMKRVKEAFDPDGILNPGKIFPANSK